ncbi:PKS-NRPS hybrid synthetase [Glycine soja]
MQKIDEDQWMYDNIISEEVEMNVKNEEDAGVKVDCSDAFNTFELFGSREKVLQWARSLAHDIRFVVVIMRSDTNTDVRGRASFLLIACERSGQYRPKKHNLVRACTGSRKYGCSFKLRAKLVSGGDGWMVKLICGIHNHEMAKSLVGHPYASRLTKDEKNVVVDMTKSTVKPRNILLTLKEHDNNNYTTIKQIYNTKHAYRSSIRGSNTEMQQLMMLLDRDQYIQWHRVKDDNVLRDLFWSHPNAIKLTNSCNLVFLIDSTYKTNRNDILRCFAYLEGECLNNVVWALERFRCLFMRIDAIPRVIVTDRDLSLMNAMKIVFPDSTNLLCRFHIDKNVKVKCKTLVAQKNAWDYVMEAWGSLISTLKTLKWLALRGICLWTKCVKHRVETAHWSLKRLLQNSVGDICNVWEAMNNMMTLQHT